MLLNQLITSKVLDDKLSSTHDFSTGIILSNIRILIFLPLTLKDELA